MSASVSEPGLANKIKHGRSSFRILLVGIGAESLPRLASQIATADLLAFRHPAELGRAKKVVSEFQPDLVICRSLSGTLPIPLALGLSSLSGREQEGGPTRGPGRLNDRQREVLFLLSRGLQNREIAQNLGVSTRTIKGYLTGLFARFEVSNRTELVGAAIERGLVDNRAVSMDAA